MVQKFIVISVKRNTSGGFHRFRKVPSEMRCANWILDQNFQFLMTNGKRSLSTILIDWFSKCELHCIN